MVAGRRQRSLPVQGGRAWNKRAGGVMRPALRPMTAAAAGRPAID
ncbi:hypothetical protein [Paenibacillus dendritiformis]|nr:hypothetical protein [Paenibacillus dendritiformis]